MNIIKKLFGQEEPDQAPKSAGKKFIALICMLQNGEHYSVVEIMRNLYISDPRSVIRDIRNKGITVCDEWIKGADGVRYKKYWIDTKL